MSSYGQVYHGMYADGLGFRGILMDDEHAEVYVGLRRNTPTEAFDDMTKNAGKFGITDLRQTSFEGEELAERLATIQHEQDDRDRREKQTAQAKAAKPS